MSDTKAENIVCNICTSDNNPNSAKTDKTRLIDEENLKNFPKIISCGECLNDEDEESCYYHPDCFGDKHSTPGMSNKKIQKHRDSHKEMTSEELIKLSSAEKVIFVRKGVKEDDPRKAALARVTGAGAAQLVETFGYLGAASGVASIALGATASLVTCGMEISVHSIALPGTGEQLG